MYRLGAGVPRNYRKAVEHYQKAAHAADAQAQYLLGQMLENGWGVQADGDRAYQYYEMAYQAGYKAACRALERCAEHGIGRPKNGRHALAYYREGAQAGDGMSMYELAQCYYQGRLVKKSKKQAEIWCERAWNTALESGQRAEITELLRMLTQKE